MMKAASGKPPHDIDGISGHLFDDAPADCGEVEGATAGDDDGFVAPLGKDEDSLEGFACDDEGCPPQAITPRSGVDG